MQTPPEKLRALLKSKNMTAHALCEELNVHRNTVSAWLNGKSKMPETVQVWLDKVQTSPSFAKPDDPDLRPEHLVGTMPEEAFNPNVKPVGHPFYAHVPEPAFLWVPAFTTLSGERLPGRWTINYSKMTSEERHLHGQVKPE